jgi:hypothetical protein
MRKSGCLINLLFILLVIFGVFSNGTEAVNNKVPIQATDGKDKNVCVKTAEVTDKDLPVEPVVNDKAPANDAKNIRAFKPYKDQPAKQECYCPCATQNANTRTRISAHGTYLRGHPDGRVDLTTNNDSWEKWTWTYLDTDRFTWRSFHGTYLRAHPNGKVDLAPAVNDWEIWHKEIINGKNAWRSHHGTYLRGYPNGFVDLAEHAQAWELWDD